MQVVSDAANGSPVTRLLRLNPDGLKQGGGRDVVSVGNERDRHPRMDGLFSRAQVAQPPAGTGGENERERDRQQKGESNGQYALPRSSHKFNITGLPSETRERPAANRTQPSSPNRRRA